MPHDSAMRRYVPLVLLVAGNCWAEEPAMIKERLRAELKQVHRYEPPKPVESSPVPLDEKVLELEKLVVTKPVFHIEDLLAAARRQAEAEKAKQFSPLTGGLIYAKNFGGKELNLGIWPKLVPVDEIPALKKGEVMLRVDLLRLKW